ncbi:hypothetical protein ACUZ9P_02405 [Desulfovibrio sp. QI0430]
MTDQQKDRDEALAEITANRIQKIFYANSIKRAFIDSIVPVTLLLITGILAISFYFFPEDFDNLLSQESGIKRLSLSVGSMAISISIIVFFKSILARLEHRPLNFIDIEKQRINSSRSEIFKILQAKETFSDTIPQKSIQKDLNPSDYFAGMISFFSERIKKTNESASYLLDTGRAYSKYGLWFYILTIIAWQILIYNTEFHVQHIYGIAGCSLIFIFVQFMSAWFLKQYRYSIDTSIHLIKIKTIIERYFLTYLIVKESHRNNKCYTEAFTVLKEDIKWPETYLTKNPDVSFAKEFMETATQLIRAAKSEAKPEAKKSNG